MGYATDNGISGFIDSAPHALVVSDESGKIVQVNKSAERLLGYGPGEMVGLMIETLVPRSVRSRHVIMRNAHQVQPAGGQPHDTRRQLEAVRKDGARIGVVIGISMWDRPCGRFHVAFIVDDEARRAAERMALEEHRAALDAGELSQAIIQGASLGIMLFDATSGECTSVNDAAVRMVAGTRDALMGRDFRTMTSWRESGLAAAATEALAGRTSISRDVELVAGTGKRVTLRCECMPVARSSRPHLVVVMEDLTQRQSLEAQLLVAQKMEAVGQLAGGVAHDFNNLLTVIGTYSSLMLETCAADDPSREDLGEIFSAAQRAAELTRQLLAFGRRQLLDARQLDLNEVVGGFEKMLRRVISAEISLSIVRADDLGAVLADSGQIEQTLLNLVVNARDAMPQGGRLTIETRNVRTVPDATPGRAMAPDSDSEPVAMVMLRVSDNGIGMDEETAARVFEPFFTTKDPGRGTGLGLSTTYGIVTQSGGFVRVHSRVGEGSAFELYFPRMADAVPQPAPMASPDAADTRGTGDIVVVEDDEHVRKIVVNALAALGYTVFEATNGAEALDMVLARDAPPDLLVTDLIMPRLNGRDLVQRLRSRWPEMPVLFTTAYAMDEQTDQAASELPGALLRKPFIPAELAVAVRAALQTSAP